MAVTTALVHRLLETPDLVETVRSLDGRSLAALLGGIGVEDSGELLAMVTTEQFVALVDDALWGEDDRFDHANFATWLEVIAEGGDEALARRLGELPEETLAMALFGQVFALDVETLGIGMAGVSRHEAELAERVLDSSLYLELGDFVLVAKRALGWDVVIEALTALDAVDHERLERVLGAVAFATAECLDEYDGFEGLLDHAQMLDEDADAGREARRGTRGYVARSDARAFLGLAARGAEAVPERDSLTRAYFRDLAGARPGAASAERASPELSSLLDELGVRVAADRALPTISEAQLRGALAELPGELPIVRQAELAYLANVIVAADQGHEPLSAARLAIECCARGLSRASADGRSAVAVLREHGLDQLFRLGWAEPCEARDPATS